MSYQTLADTHARISANVAGRLRQLGPETTDKNFQKTARLALLDAPELQHDTTDTRQLLSFSGPIKQPYQAVINSAMRHTLGKLQDHAATSTNSLLPTQQPVRDIMIQIKVQKESAKIEKATATLATLLKTTPSATAVPPAP